MIAAASYEARKYGVYSAMPSKVAVRKCPFLIFAKAHFAVYKEVSEQIRAIFLEYTDLVEPLSLDEAFLDVTVNKKDNPSATRIATEIRERILEKTGLTASAGISFNKFLAKIASDYNKPNGQFLIKPKDAESFLEELPVEKFFGVGKVTAKKMHSLGVYTGADLKARSREELSRVFKKQGTFFYQIVRAIDNRAVNPDRVRKSIGAEYTYSDDLHTRPEMQEKIEELVQHVAHRLQKAETTAHTLSLKIKFNDFTIITRSKTIASSMEHESDIRTIAMQLFDELDLTDKAVRLLGISLANLNNQESYEAIQLSFDFID